MQSGWGKDEGDKGELGMCALNVELPTVRGEP